MTYYYECILNINLLLFIYLFLENKHVQFNMAIILNSFKVFVNHKHILCFVSNNVVQINNALRLTLYL